MESYLKNVRENTIGFYGSLRKRFAAWNLICELFNKWTVLGKNITYFRVTLHHDSSAIQNCIL